MLPSLSCPKRKSESKHTFFKKMPVLGAFSLLRFPEFGTGSQKCFLPQCTMSKSIRNKNHFSTSVPPSVQCSGKNWADQSVSPTDDDIRWSAAAAAVKLSHLGKDISLQLSSKWQMKSSKSQIESSWKFFVQHQRWAEEARENLPLTEFQIFVLLKYISPLQ